MTDLQVTLVESVEKNEKLRFPAITLCVIPGWANWPGDARFVGVYKRQCQNETTAERFLGCIKNNTFSFKDLVVSASHGYPFTNTFKNLSDFSFWTWDMTVAVAGRCYTLDYNVPVGIDQEKDILVIKLNRSLNHYAILHQTDLFALTTNRLAATTYRQLDAKMFDGATQTLTLQAVKWKQLNRPERPCNPSSDYNFTQCVIESKAKQVGCTLPWNKQIPGMYSTKQNR